MFSESPHGFILPVRKDLSHVGAPATSSMARCLSGRNSRTRPRQNTHSIKCARKNLVQRLRQLDPQRPEQRWELDRALSALKMLALLDKTSNAA
jgi:hypothetical protein